MRESYTANLAIPDFKANFLFHFDTHYYRRHQLHWNILRLCVHLLTSVIVIKSAYIPSYVCTYLFLSLLLAVFLSRRDFKKAYRYNIWGNKRKFAFFSFSLYRVSSGPFCWKVLAFGLCHTPITADKVDMDISNSIFSYIALIRFLDLEHEKESSANAML